MSSKEEMESKWLAGMEQRRKRSTRKCATLPPWDEYVYFDPPLCHLEAFTVGQPSKLFIKTNPYRVALLLSVVVGGTVSISPFSQANFNNGLVIGNNQIPFTMKQAEYGNLVQGEWYGIAQGSNSIYVVEVLLREWPTP